MVIGACLAPTVKLVPLLCTLGAFFLAVGVAAHALDELQGRPLRTRISGPVLIAVSVASLAGALGFGVYGVIRVGWVLVPFMVAGPLLVIAYNAELLHGVVHNDLGFAAAWGSFPVLTAYVAETGRLNVAPVLAAGAALGLSAAQRSLSTPARMLRRKTGSVTGAGGRWPTARCWTWTGPGCWPRWSTRCGPCPGPWCCWPPRWQWPGCARAAAALAARAALDDVAAAGGSAGQPSRPPPAARRSGCGTAAPR